MPSDDSDLLHDTVLGDEWRWAIVVLGLAAMVIMIGLWRRRRAARDMDFAESLSLTGGALVCGSVSLASLGIILDWDSLWRLPLLAVALAYVVVGRGIQLWRSRRRREN